MIGINPSDDWRELGWCCRECALTAHNEWRKEHGLAAIK